MSRLITETTVDDVHELLKLARDVPEIASSCSEVLQNVSSNLCSSECSMSKGLSFLNLKNLSMLNYISNLCYVILRKLNGKQIEGDPSIKRLVELRITMEKMRPIEEKLKYQINKSLATVTTQNVDNSDPLQYRANPDSLEVEDDEDQEPQKERKIYVPPKISASYYEEGSLQDKKKKMLDQAQKQVLSSSMLYELRKEYDTGPEEIKETHDPHKIKLSEELQKRERYEEEFMLRLPMTKKQRHDMKQLTTVSNFNSNFEDISAVEMKSDTLQIKKKNKGRGKYKGKNRKKGFKKNH